MSLPTPLPASLHHLRRPQLPQPPALSTFWRRAWGDPGGRVANSVLLRCRREILSPLPGTTPGERQAKLGYSVSSPLFLRGAVLTKAPQCVSTPLAEVFQKPLRDRQNPGKIRSQPSGSQPSATNTSSLGWLSPLTKQCSRGWVLTQPGSIACGWANREEHTAMS